jgi:small basic protein
VRERHAMWLPIAGLGLGVLLGLFSQWTIPQEYARYTAVAVLAALDSMVGATRASLEGHYRNRVFLSGLVGNAVLALLITYLGDRLGSDLYLAAIVAFGVRLFNNFSKIRQLFLG